MHGRVKSTLARFAALRTQEKWLFIRAVWTLPMMICAMRFVALRRVQRWIERPDQPFGNKKAALRMNPRIITRITFAASKYGLVRGNCLSRSLILCYLLRREGYDARLRLGGRQEGKSFEAHAWVELNGEPVDERDEIRSSFVPFPIQFNTESQIPR